MKAEIFFEPSEMIQMEKALDFFGRQFTLSSETSRMVFRDGGNYSMEYKTLVNIFQLCYHLRHAVEEELNRPRFAGYCKVN